jgi:hypothetical protein
MAAGDSSTGGAAHSPPRPTLGHSQSDPNVVVVLGKPLNEQFKPRHQADGQRFNRLGSICHLCTGLSIDHLQAGHPELMLRVANWEPAWNTRRLATAQKTPTARVPELLKSTDLGFDLFPPAGERFRTNPCDPSRIGVHRREDLSVTVTAREPNSKIALAA